MIKRRIGKSLPVAVYVVAGGRNRVASTHNVLTFERKKESECCDCGMYHV